MREIFEHTADAGIRAEGSTLAEALNEVSLAFTEIVTGGIVPDSNNNFKVEIEATTLDSLLVNYISHLIYLFDTENFLVSSADIAVNIETDAILGRASPRNPRVEIDFKSSNLYILLVACLVNASFKSSLLIPLPLSET